MFYFWQNKTFFNEAMTKSIFSCKFFWSSDRTISYLAFRSSRKHRKKFKSRCLKSRWMFSYM